METNERVMFRQEQKITRLTTQLNRVRLNENKLYLSPSRKNTSLAEDRVENLTFSPSRSPLRPEHVEKLKKQLSGRKSIPVRSSPKTGSATKILFNRKPQQVIDANEQAHFQINRPKALAKSTIPKFNLDDSNSSVFEPVQSVSHGSVNLNDSKTVAGENVKIVRDTTSNVVSYMPSSMTIPTNKPGSMMSSKTKESFGTSASESRWNLNNPPQGLGFVSNQIYSINE
jgi:hypothetical protein